MKPLPSLAGSLWVDASRPGIKQFTARAAATRSGATIIALPLITIPAAIDIAYKLDATVIVARPTTPPEGLNEARGDGGR